MCQNCYFYQFLIETNLVFFPLHSIEIGLQFSQDTTTMSLELFIKKSTVLDPFEGPTNIVFGPFCDPADQN